MTADHIYSTARVQTALKLKPFFDAEVRLSIKHANEAEQKAFTAEQKVKLIQQRAGSHPT